MGTWPSKVDEILAIYGVESEATIHPEFVDKFSREGAISDGQIYIASAYNSQKGLSSGIHTFEIVYSPSQNPKEPWVAYNIDSGTDYKTSTTFSGIFKGAVQQISKIKMGGTR